MPDFDEAQLSSEWRQPTNAQYTLPRTQSASHVQPKTKQSSVVRTQPKTIIKQASFFHTPTPDFLPGVCA